MTYRRVNYRHDAQMKPLKWELDTFIFVRVRFLILISGTLESHLGSLGRPVAASD